MANDVTDTSDIGQAEALANRVFGATVSAVDLLTVYVGDRLGLYRILGQQGPLRPAELAIAAGMHPRYAREWLEQQAVTGILLVDDPSAPMRSGATPCPPATPRP